MKLRPIIVLITAAIFVFSSIACAGLGEFTKVAENEYLELYVNYQNTEIAVKDLQMGSIWYSNPPERNKVEKIARGINKDKLSALFSLSYYTPNDHLIQINSYNDSVVYQQFDFTQLENGIKVSYTLGKEWADDAYIPIMINKESFEELILSKIENKQEQKFVHDSYDLVILEEKPADYERISVIRLDKEAIFRNYSLAAPGQSLNASTKRRIIESVLDQVAKANNLRDRFQVKFENLPQGLLEPTYVLRSDLLIWDYEDLAKIIKETGFTPFQTSEEHIDYGIAPPVHNELIFKVPVVYELEGDNLVVTVLAEEIQYPQNIVGETGKVSYPIYQFDLLEYFGAPDINQKDGYIFVPDGTGALISLSNGKLSAGTFDSPVYGIDESLSVTTAEPNIGEQIYLPVFGIVHKDTALFGMIEAGESFARIRADIAGKRHSYNYVHPRFTILPKAEARLQGKIPGGTRITTMNIYQAKQYSGDFRIRYKFLSGEAATYVGLAKYYQDFLFSQGLLKKNNVAADVPFVVQAIGGISAKKSFLGFPRTEIIPLTRFNELDKILTELNANGVSNIYLKYSGWLTGGMHRGITSTVDLENALGSNKEFNELTKKFAVQGVKFFPEVSFLNAYPSPMERLFKSGCFTNTLTREVGLIYAYDPVTGERIRGSERYLISPAVLPRLISSFINDYPKYSLNGIAFEYLGNQLSSNFEQKPEKLINREQAKEIIVQQLQYVKEHNLAVTVNGGHLYTLPYADIILNLPEGGSGYTITDEHIPFYQIVVHGYVPYAYQPINIASVPTNTLLKIVETGAIPSFLWTYNDSSLAKNTDFDYIYNTQYKLSFESAVELYKRINPILSQIQDQRIVNHLFLTKGVYQTVYENGLSFIVNYNDTPVTISGIEVLAQDFIVRELHEKGGD